MPMNNSRARKDERRVTARLRKESSEKFACGHLHTHAVQYEKCKGVRYWLDGPNAGEMTSSEAARFDEAGYMPNSFYTQTPLRSEL